MILYLDTSSLVKLYVEEDESSKVAALVNASSVTATSIVAYAEARAAFARRFREKAFASKAYNLIRESFDNDWDKYMVLNLTGATIKMAGDLAERHSLRGFDAIHLASAVTLKRELTSPVTFSCFDENLNKVAWLEGLKKVTASS
jgi:uncharacterized protein